MARENGDNGDLQRASCGTGSAAQAESGGDRQADLTAHGGEQKAVYCYSLAHYDYWKRELPGQELPRGRLEKTLRLTMADRDC